MAERDRGSRRAMAPDGRDESENQRADRLWGELLQEVRIAQTGGQILVAFLLSVAFTPRFAQLGTADRNIYVVTVLLGAAATGALMAPVSFHRIVTGHRLKPQAVIWASRFTLVGLVLLLCSVTSALLLILRVVLGGDWAVSLSCVLMVWFAVCWFLPPLWVRHHGRAHR